MFIVKRQTISIDKLTNIYDINVLDTFTTISIFYNFFTGFYKTFETQKDSNLKLNKVSEYNSLQHKYSSEETVYLT